jgi:hypothetical protein
MARWLFVLLVVFLALVSVAPPAPAQVYVLPHHAYFPLVAKGCCPTPTPLPPPTWVIPGSPVPPLTLTPTATFTPIPFLLDMLVYPEEPDACEDIYLTVFGREDCRCWVAEEIACELIEEDRPIVLTAELKQGWCYQKDPGIWGYMEHIWLRRPVRNCIEPGEWTAEFRAFTPDGRTEIVSVTFNVLPHTDPHDL